MTGEPGEQPARKENPGEAKDAPPKRRWLMRIVLALVALLALVAGGIWLFHWWTEGRFIESTNDAYLQADQVAVSARVGGLVEAVLVADNETVEAGQPLVRLDSRDIQARIAQARAQAEVARAAVAQGEAQVAAQEAQVAQLQAQVEGSQSQAAYADREAARYARLATTGAETRETADRMRQNRDQAQAQLAQHQAALLGAQRQIETMRAQVGQARAQISQADALGQQSQVDLDSTLVRSSLRGRVGDRTVRVGQYVQPGTRMMTVVPVQDIYLVANFKETQIGRLRPGQEVDIRVDALPGTEVRGVVDSISPGTGAQFALIPPNNATGNFTKIVQRVSVRIRLEADERARQVLVPGLSVTARIDTRSAPRATAERPRQDAALKTTAP